MTYPSSLAPLEALPDASLTSGPEDTALVMGGGGARAAYQVGFLRYLAQRFPELSFPYIHGVSAGAINAAMLASHHGSFLQAVRELSGLWGDLRMDDVFRVDSRGLAANIFRWLRQLGSGGLGGTGRGVRGLVDTAPLRGHLTEALHAVDGEITGVQANLDRGRLRAFAITTTSYTSGSTVTWLQGHDIEPWSRPQRITRRATMTVEHIMASAALPLLFPAVQLGRDWYGDGGIRLTAPLSPALHLGARRILAVSTRYDRTQAEWEQPTTDGYPPPAQVAGVLLNAVFLDQLDNDAVRLQRLNRLLEAIPEVERHGLRPVKLLILRPSRDLGRLSSQFETRLPGTVRFLTRGLGTRETESPDVLSLILFQPDYLRALMEIGEEDAHARADEIAAFMTS